MFKRAAPSPEQGYQITTDIGTGVDPSPNPTLPQADGHGQTPPEAAHKDTRPIYWDEDWHDADIWEMDELKAGNRIVGPSVIESPATTVLVPPCFEAPLDENHIFHLGGEDQ